MTTTQKEAACIPLCPKKAPGTTGTEIKGGVLVNAFPVKILKNIPLFKYDLSIIANFPNTKIREITKQRNDDYSEVGRKSLVTQIMGKLVEEESEFFHKGKIYHDKAACLYSLVKLLISEEDNEKVFVKPGDYVPNVGANAEAVTITIKPSGEKFQANTNNLDNLFKEFANIATSHEIYLNPEVFTVYGNDLYVTSPAKAGFQASDAPELPGMAVLLPVIKKSVKVVEGPIRGKPPMAVMIVDISKSPVHMPCPLLDKIQSIVYDGARRQVSLDLAKEMRGNRVLKALKQLHVVPKYRRDARPIIIKSIADSADAEIIGDLKISVTKYYQEKLKITLKFPRYPCIRDIRDNCYPVEILEVLDFQRVRKPQELPSQTEKIIRASAILPIIRREQTKKAFKALNLETSQMMLNAGLAVQREMITVPARSLPLPKILYGGNRYEAVAFGKWWLGNGVKFFGPAILDKWAVWANVEDRNLVTLGAFCDRIVDRAQARGMRVKPPTKTQIDSRDLEKHFEEAAAGGIKFIFMVSEDYEEVHEQLKYFELKFGIATQEVRWSVARKTVDRNQIVTLDNIVMKMNLKNRGLNHNVQFPTPAINALISSPTRLIIGIEMSHPAPGNKDKSASVIGWAANCLRHPAMYTGNYIFSNPRQTNPDVTAVFHQVLDRLIKYRKDKITHIDIFMGGVSEGQLQEQTPSVVKQCLEVCAEFKFAPQVMLVAVAMEHSERLYNVRIEGDRADQQNIKPGTVVDKQIVQLDLTEFFLASHSPVQGTSSIPKYTVCVDMSNRKIDDIQMEIYGLCHLHQHSLRTTAKPTPLYVAGEYAKRGAEVVPFIEANDLADGKWSIEALNQVTYSNSVLDSARMA